MDAETTAALAASTFGPFECRHAAEPPDLRALLADAPADALILHGGETAVEFATELGLDVALLVLVDRLTPSVLLDWLGRGAQDVLRVADLTAEGLPPRLRAAIERERLRGELRTAYATDLDTGLPHQQQLLEHMSQLLALREREPAPMALLALRIEGLASAEARFGRDAAGVLRRKLGVRLRAGVRASDVVASLGDDSFAVLLGSVLTPQDAERVGSKLLKAMMGPFQLAGQEVSVATAIGIGLYPEDGNQPEVLLRRALGLAAAAQAQGRAGFSNFAEAGASAGAANDE